MDIAIAWDPRNFRGDWGVTSGDLAIDTGGLRSAVMVSLFTDGAAPVGYTPPAGSLPGRRGWWGDTFAPQPIGSLLWTLDRSKKSGDLQLLNEAANICEVALQWLLDAGVVATVTIRTAWQQRDVMGIGVTLTQPDGTSVPFDFGWAWRGI